nr:PREDICTED: protein-associating with the carboxyl-terminal domain of ezrin isoform X2 [Latimeria chalumnae]|eukprot:XP_014351439.1 PREDICTED: protein-associating with the carboxyl-terminal domain of ezrin isoform X2 [Latimeria chalumnae]
MGSENSALKSYTLEPPLLSFPSGLTIYPAVLQDGKLASVFVYQRGSEDKVNKAAKHLKTLRHPCLLRFLSCTVAADGIHLVTERVQPLELVLEHLYPEEIYAGIYDILQALVFLHNRGNCSHNNVCLLSVFVSEDGQWKLGGMDTVCKFTEATPEFLRNIQQVRDQSCTPSEEKASAELKALPEAHGHARDAYAFGTLIESLLTMMNNRDLVLDFRQTVQTCLLNPDPLLRSHLNTLISHEVFRNDFLEVVNFLKSLTLKTEEEKNEFFKFLLDRVQSLPEELIATRLAPKLLNSLVLAEPVAVKSFLPHLLRPKRAEAGNSQLTPLLSEGVFQEFVVPLLLKLFKVREEHVRLVLLSCVDTYAELFSQEELKGHILPQVLLGLRDTDDTLVASTLRALALLVPLLGAQVVVGGERRKIFKRTTPSFTRSTDITPEDSPVHVVSSNQPVKNNSLNLFSKGSLTGREKETRLQTSQARRAEKWTGKTSLNLLTNGVYSQMETSNIGKDHTLDRTLASTEWPDWSESEESEVKKTVEIQIHSAEQLANQSNDNLVEDEPWDDFEPSSEGSDLASNNSSRTKTEQTSGVPSQHSDSTLPCDVKLSKALKLKSTPKSSQGDPYDSWSNETWHPSSGSEERKQANSLTQKPLEKKPPVVKKLLPYGLGEEFTIEARRKTQTDPELDFFADMMPEIKPSSMVLVQPEHATEPAVTSLLRGEEKTEKAEGSQMSAFTSKFAAVDLNEGDAEGWGGDEELNWEEETNW